MACVVSRSDLHHKRKLHKNVISSLFASSANNHGIANKRIIDRDRIKDLTKPGSYYIYSILPISIVLGVFNVRDFL